MTRGDRSRSRGLRMLLGSIEAVDFVAGTNVRHLGSTIVMMLTALVGCAVPAVALGLAGILIAALGLMTGPFAWLGMGILWTGIVGGSVGAAIVMLKLIRRHRILATLAGFSEGEGDGAVDVGRAAMPSPIVAPTAPMTAERMRALDARLSAPPASDQVAEAAGDSLEPKA